MTRKTLQLVVCGSSGRMGSRVATLAKQDARFALNAGLDVAPSFTPAAAFAAADVIIDFSVPAASVGFAQAAAAARKPLVIGVTGFSEIQRGEIAAAARQTPIFLSANFSPGVTLMRHLARTAAARLNGYDAAITDIHHTAKKDAPSGTALRIADAVNAGRGTNAAVPIVSQRLGDVVGEHTLTFAGPYERLELTHRAHSRDVFARGALEAAAWIINRAPGLYDMPDMMGLS